MIPRDAAVTYARIPLNRITVRELEPGFPDVVRNYLGLLERHPGQDVMPIVVGELPGGFYEILNGRHRFMAYLLAGQQDIGAVIVNRKED